MTLYIIGLGLHDEKDISIKGLEIIKRCDKIYFENYTSVLEGGLKRLEKFYGKKIIAAGRGTIEGGEDHILEEAREKETALLVIGDPFSATTHIGFLKQGFYKGVPVKVINNASVLTAVGVTGLQLYKFGRVASIPFFEEFVELETPYEVLKENQKQGLHTLFLLDLKPAEERFMTVNEALDILEKIEERKKEGVVKKEMLVVGCARLGGEDYVVKKGSLEELKGVDLGKPPHCLVVPGKLHFMEEEVLEIYTL